MGEAEEGALPLDLAWGQYLSSHWDRLPPIGTFSPGCGETLEFVIWQTLFLDTSAAHLQMG